MANESRGLLPRRSMLMGIGGGLAAAGAIAAPGVGTTILSAVGGDQGEAVPGSNVALAHADAAEWRRHVGSTFLVRSELGPLYLVLASIKALPEKGDRPDELKRQAGFSARFVANNGKLPAGDLIYRVMHAEKGELDIYFSPAGESLSAIFN